MLPTTMSHVQVRHHHHLRPSHSKCIHGFACGMRERITNYAPHRDECEASACRCCCANTFFVFPLGKLSPKRTEREKTKKKSICPEMKSATFHTRNIWRDTAIACVIRASRKLKQFDHSRDRERERVGTYTFIAFTEVFSVHSNSNSKWKTTSDPTEHCFTFILFKAQCVFGPSCERWTWQSLWSFAWRARFARFSRNVYVEQIDGQKQKQKNRNKYANTVQPNPKHSKMMQTRWWECIPASHFSDCDAKVIQRTQMRLLTPPLHIAILLMLFCVFQHPRHTIVRISHPNSTIFSSFDSVDADATVSVVVVVIAAVVVVAVVVRGSTTVVLTKVRALLRWWHIPCLIDRFTSSARQHLLFFFPSFCRRLDNTFVEFCSRADRRARARSHPRTNPIHINCGKFSFAGAQHQHFR